MGEKPGVVADASTAARHLSIITSTGTLSGRHGVTPSSVNMTLFAYPNLGFTHGILT